MTSRHHPRICGACSAPLAGQRDDCWSCGVTWSATGAAAPAATPATAKAAPR